MDDQKIFISVFVDECLTVSPTIEIVYRPPARDSSSRRRLSAHDAQPVGRLTFTVLERDACEPAVARLRDLDTGACPPR